MLHLKIKTKPTQQTVSTSGSAGQHDLFEVLVPLET